MRYWNTSNIVALVCFFSVSLLPWFYLARGKEGGFVDLLITAMIWLVIGTFAAANATDWKKKTER